MSYGSILLVTGRWAEAERQLTAALESARTAERALYGEALGRLATLRIGQGRLEEAEQLLVGFDDHPATAFATALLRLSRCDAVAAETVVLRGLRALGAPHPGRHPGGAAVVEEASLLELLTVAQLARGALDDARATSERLSALARRTGLGVVDGVAHRAAGRVQDAVGEPGAAFSELERALDVFTGSELPHEVARTHLLLARSANDRERAVHEARTALNGFAQLGAERDADAAAAFLREHGVHVARHGRRDPGVLTRREREVLALLAEGLPNREIAERLFLTRKTVEHHVRSVLRKLGLRSRAEAAAFAARRLERDSASI